MKRLFILLILAPVWLQGQYIYEVLEYQPAPGQFINKEPWGLPSSAQSIIGGVNGYLSLGAFGGYVVFRFEHPVLNHPDNPFGVDFIIYGNPLPWFSEPGIVSVMRDDNNNGLADDTWYELAGSDYYFSSTRHKSVVTYFNPGQPIATDVPWQDETGATGVVMAKSFHQQPYYPLPEHFPGINPQQQAYSGTRITGAIDRSTSGTINSSRRAFGYSDNTTRGIAPWDVPTNPYSKIITNAGGDGFDISWAVDAKGNYIELDKIDFIKVHTAVLDDGEWLGEFSTEITGAVVVKPDNSISGNTTLMVIKDLPPVLTHSPVALEAIVFQNGRPQWNTSIEWTTDADGAFIDQEGLLHLSKAGKITVTATATGQPGVTASVSSVVSETLGSKPSPGLGNVKLHPNPASMYIVAETPMGSDITIYDTSGRSIISIREYSSGSMIDLTTLLPGMYLLQVKTSQSITSHKFMKH
jgi:hypothetical protein